MKPKSLSIKGMYSYKKELQTIDFLEYLVMLEAVSLQFWKPCL